MMNLNSKAVHTSIHIFVFLLLNQLPTTAQSLDDWANFSKYADANKGIAPGKIVFLGNSITEGWPKADPSFFEDHDYIGRGIGGQTTSQMLVRFRQDVIGLKPKAVVILAGVNDIARNTGYISLENIFGNIVSMVDLARAYDIKVVLCSVLPASSFRWRPELTPADDILKLNQMIKTYAERTAITYVDYHSALKDNKNGLPKKYAEDGVHPNRDGYDVMKNLLQKELLKLE